MSVKKSLNILLISLFLLSYVKSQNPFEKLIENLKKDAKMKLMAVAGADMVETLTASRQAKDMKICDSILIGDEQKIKNNAKAANIDISDFKIVNILEPIEISKYASKLVHDGDADMFVKGSIETSDVLKAILDDEIGLRTDKKISLVAAFELKKRLILFTDPSVIPYPSLQDKVALIENAVSFAKSTGVQVPKVGVVTALSVVNPRMTETIDAKELTLMNKNGKIKDCVVDGPLSLDLAISPDSAKIKQSSRDINGDADIVLFPDIHSANISYKIMTQLGNGKNGSILMGTSKPVILSSRSDSAQTKLYSIILGFTYDKFNAKN